MAASNSYTPRLGETVEHFEKPKRAVNVAFLHCSATSNPNFDAKACHDLHVDSNGWSAIGYHYLLKTDGTLQYGRDAELVPAAQSGYNEGSLAISLNGLNPSDFNQAQFDRLLAFCQEIDAAYAGIRFRGHKEVAAKDCPVFDYHAVLGLNSEGFMTGEPGEGTAPPASKIPMIPVTVNLAQLGLGDNHPHVRWIRGLLGSIYGIEVGSEEEFTQWLHDQLCRFQGDHNLVVDGICGKQCWTTLLDVGDD